MARDRLSASEAAGVLAHAPGSGVSHAEALRLCARLGAPRRGAPVSLDDVGPVAAACGDLPPFALHDLQRQAGALGAALREAVAGLSVDDRALIHDRYTRGLTVAEIARATGQDQKRLYRRCERLLARLRAALVRARVRVEDVRELAGHALVQIEGVLQSDTAA